MKQNILKNKGQKLKLTTLGFTLIELLAVIVILAIIALIVVPILLSIIGDTKKVADQKSIENYIHAVELAITKKSMNNVSKNLDGKYKIDNNKIIKKNCELDCDINVEIDEIVLESGTVTIQNGKVKQLNHLDENGRYISLKDDKITIMEKVKSNTLIKGNVFNAKIKQLFNNNNPNGWTVDEKVTSIEFLSLGQLPEGYTLTQLKKMSRIDVSEKNDGSVVLYYDLNTGKIYVYSDGLIKFNSDSSEVFMNFRSVTNIEFGEIDTNQVIKMSYMFSGCNSLTSIDLSNFDTSQVTTMSNMFNGCNSLKELDVSNFDTSNVTTMSWMFGSNKGNKLSKLDLSNFDTSQVTNMTNMFYNCNALTLLDISNFDTSKAINMDGMFQWCSSLITLDLNFFNTSSVTNMENMFSGCRKLKSLDVSSFDTSSVTNMYGMFRYCNSLEQLDVSNFNTSNVTNMSVLFDQCSVLLELDLSNWDTSKVTTIRAMFYYTTNLKPIYVGENWVINEGTNITNMFIGSKTKSVEELCEPDSTHEWCFVS